MVGAHQRKHHCIPCCKQNMIVHINKLTFCEAVTQLLGRPQRVSAQARAITRRNEIPNGLRHAILLEKRGPHDSHIVSISVGDEGE